VPSPNGGEDFNNARPHSSLGYQPPTAFAKVFTATDGVTETVEALIAAG
jgi:putative transposase